MLKFIDLGIWVVLILRGFFKFECIFDHGIVLLIQIGLRRVLNCGFRLLGIYGLEFLGRV